jgi:hypothetical protein
MQLHCIVNAAELLCCGACPGSWVPRHLGILFKVPSGKPVAMKSQVRKMWRSHPSQTQGDIQPQTRGLLLPAEPDGG